MHDFFPYLPRFRAWTSGAGREAGSAQGDAIRNITGWSDIMGKSFAGFWGSFSGALTAGSASMSPQIEATLSEGNPYHQISIDTSRVVPTAGENRPSNIALPVILYLGLSV